VFTLDVTIKSKHNNTDVVKIKDKFGPAHAMKAYRGSTIITPLTLNLNFGWR
jgi:hypothetical protein